MGLIHKNNIDNQPIEYAYRTPIIIFNGILSHIKAMNKTTELLILNLSKNSWA